MPYEVDPKARIIPQVWQYDLDYPPNLPSDEELNLKAISVKTHDGVTWMGYVDSHSSGVRNYNEWVDLYRSYKERGIECIPWCVPKGIDIATEADLAVLVASVSGVIILDIEVEPNSGDFWVGGVHNVQPYMEAIRSRFKGKIILQYDSRRPKEMFIDEWLPYVDELLSMDYWTDFRDGLSDQETLTRAANNMAYYEKPYGFTLPANDSSYDFTSKLEGDIYLWRRGTMTPACVELVKSQVKGGPIVEPEPEPEIPTKTLEEKINDLYMEALKQNDRIVKLETTLENMIDASITFIHSLKGADM